VGIAIALHLAHRLLHAARRAVHQLALHHGVRGPEACALRLGGRVVAAVTQATLHTTRTQTGFVNRAMPR
jgi:hypothetical protein